MPVICFASPKGGAGKTTSAVVLAAELARAGAAVTLIDADPNRFVVAWASLPGCPDHLSVLGDPQTSPVNEENITDLIDSESQKSAFVIVDLEGTASVMVSYAISRADLVIVPLQGSQLDANQAGRAIKLVRQTEKVFNRTIPNALLFTRTNAAIQPRTLRHVRADLERAGVAILDTQMMEREAFRAIFSFGGTVHTLSAGEVSNLGSAQANAKAFAREVVEILTPSTAAATGTNG